jgi:transcriptional regulator with XRE-family HTH domain
MAPRSETPQGEHRRLIVALRQAREARHLTQKEVADALEWSASKLIRIERGSVGISVTDLKALLLHYKVTDANDVDRMVDMARASKKAVWWQEYRDVLNPEFFTFVGLEASAVRIKQFQILAVPGLLQSRGYTEALFGDPKNFSDRIRRVIEVRFKRQELISEDGPEIVSIIDESALHRTIGDNAVMREQLTKLRELAAHPRVSIRVMPFSAGVHQGMKNSYEILEFSNEPDDYALIFDHAYRDQLTQVPGEETRTFVEYFARLEERALPAEESARVIEARLKELQKDG